MLEQFHKQGQPVLQYLKCQQSLYEGTGSAERGIQKLVEGHDNIT